MNIFSDYGKVITSKRYIHRDLENELKNILNGGIVSIVGLPRIGKTSMIENLFKEENNYFKINFAKISSANEFFSLMMRNLYKKIKKINPEIKELYEELKEEDSKLAFEEFFEEVSFDIDEFFIFIDEFDYAQKILDRSSLEVIREIFTQNRQTKDKYNLILVSRRRIFEIEGAQNASGSTLQGVVKERFLSFYNNEEIKSYFDLLNEFIPVDENLKRKYYEYTGYHPYLSDIFSFYLLEGNSNLEEIYKTNKLTFYDYFSHVYKILEEKDLFDVLLAIIFNLPFYEENKVDILKRYGIINNNYEVFSLPFLEYCKEKFDMNDFYNIWYKTENLLRKLVKVVLKRNYNNLSEIQKKYNNERFLKDAIFYLKQQRKSNYSLEKGENFIDGLSTTGLFKIITYEWMFFEDVFKKTKEYWKEIFKEIKEIRNLISHTKKIDKETFAKINIYCNEINETIGNYFKRVKNND